MKESTDLSLPVEALELTPEKFKTIIKDLMAFFKKGSSDWKISGNGASNKNASGAVIKLIRISGVSYDELEEEEPESLPIHFVDDDRWSFCNNKIAVAYFWGKTDVHGLNTFMTQNVEKIGLSMDKRVGGTKGLAVTNKTSRKSNNVDELITQFPEMISVCMKEIHADRRPEHNIISLIDQRRKSMSYHQVW